MTASLPQDLPACSYIICQHYAPFFFYFEYIHQSYIQIYIIIYLPKKIYIYIQHQKFLNNNNNNYNLVHQYSMATSI